MKDWFLKLKIRLKLLLAFGSILTLSVFLVVIVISSTRSILDFTSLNEQMDQMNIHALMMNGHLKDFYSQGFKNPEFHLNNKSAQISGYRKAFGHQDSLMSLISSHNVLENQSAVLELMKSLDNYNKHFQSLIEAYRLRGFKDYGIEGSLRQAIHDVEEADFNYDRAGMLMLRRHEKDFFLRKDLKYLDRFNDQINDFNDQIQSSDSAGDKVQVLNSIKKYQEEFNNIVSIEKRIGLDNRSGILGQIGNDYNKIEHHLVQLSELVKSKKDALISKTIIIVSSLLAMQVIGGLILIIFYSGLLNKAIREIRNALVMLSNGSFPKLLPIRTKDEIAQTKSALNQLVIRIKEAVGFAEDLGNGKLNKAYNDEFKEDVLAKAIITLQNKLVDMNRRQEIINWTNKGLANFSEILKDDLALEALSDQLLKQLVTYTASNQGAIYHVTERNTLRRMATYAYERKRFVDQEIEMGQGLVGQAILEKDSIYMNDIPDQYVKITSGLGFATPKNILIVPLKVKDQVVGAIELAAFSVYKTHEISFIEKVSENIANLILTKANTDKTARLLSESQEKANILAAQEEELRQNTEEMHATQEQVKRNEEAAKRQISELEQKLLHKEKEIATLNLKLEHSYS
ncbi:MAG: GAF domain-containing protein [Bacteroidota bacterium]